MSLLIWALFVLYACALHLCFTFVLQYCEASAVAGSAHAATELWYRHPQAWVRVTLLAATYVIYAVRHPLSS